MWGGCGALCLSSVFVRFPNQDKHKAPAHPLPRPLSLRQPQQFHNSTLVVITNYTLIIRTHLCVRIIPSHRSCEGTYPSCQHAAALSSRTGGDGLPSRFLRSMLIDFLHNSAIEKDQETEQDCAGEVSAQHIGEPV